VELRGTGYYTQEVSPLCENKRRTPPLVCKKREEDETKAYWKISKRPSSWKELVVPNRSGARGASEERACLDWQGLSSDRASMNPGIKRLNKALPELPSIT